MSTTKLPSGMVSYNPTLAHVQSTLGHALANRSARVTDFPWLAKEDGVTDDAPAILAAATWLDSVGGGYLDLGPRDIGITALDLTSKRVVLRGQGMGLTVLKWLGTSGVMLKFGTVQTAATKLTGVGCTDLTLDCLGVADYGLQVTSVNYSKFQHLAVLNPVNTGIHFTCLDNKLTSGDNSPADNQHNTLSNIYVECITVPTATGILLDGNAGSAATVGANTSLNLISDVFCNIRDGNGLVFGFADGNCLLHLRVFRPDANTGVGLVFMNDPLTTLRHARYNQCYNIQTARASVLAKAGTGDFSKENVVYLNDGNNGVDNPPVVEVGATCTIVGHLMSVGLSTFQGLDVYGSSYTAAHANAVDQRALMGTESRRIYNNASNHMVLTNGTETWGINIDGTNGNLRLNRVAGAGFIAVATAAVDSASAQAASCAFVVGQAGTANPVMDGTVAVGTSLKYARQDHVHASDTSRAPIASPIFTGTPAAPTPAQFDNDTSLATTAFTLLNSARFPAAAGVVLASSTTLTIANAGKWFEIGNGALTTTLPALSTTSTGSTYTFRALSYDTTLKGNGSESIHGERLTGNTYELKKGMTCTIVSNGAAGWYVSSVGIGADSPEFTGEPLAPSPAFGDNSSKIATTAHVQNAIALVTYTWAGKPAASSKPVGTTIHISDVGGPAGSDFTSDGARWYSAQPILLGTSAVAVSHTGDTAEFTAATITVPNDLVGPNGFIEVEHCWTANNSTNTKTARTRFSGISGTPIAAQNMNSSNTITQTHKVRIHNRGATNSQLFGTVAGAGAGGWGTSNGSFQTGTVDTATSTTIVLTIQLAVSTDTLTLEAYTVRAYTA